MRFFLVFLTLFLSGCRNPDHNLNIYSFDESEQGLLQQAQKQFHAYHYDDAIRTLENYETLYPLSQNINFVDKLLIEAYYRNEDFPALKAAAERFMYENPQDSHIDYISYLKIIAQVEQARGHPMAFLPIDRSQRDVSAYKEAFIAAKTFLTQYPKSDYAAAVAHLLPEMKEMVARYYLWRGNDLLSRQQYIGALQAFQIVTSDFADTQSAQHADSAIKSFESRLELISSKKFDKKM